MPLFNLKWSFVAGGNTNFTLKQISIFFESNLLVKIL
jgi:hypothetical protein